MPGNDLAEKAAKEATTIVTNTILLVSLSSSIQAINETICGDPPTDERVAQVYQNQRLPRVSKQIKNRKDDVLLARLRPGHYPSRHHYPHPEDLEGLIKHDQFSL